MCLQVPFPPPLHRHKNSPALLLLTPLSPHLLPTDLPNTPHITTNQLGAPLPIEVTTSCVQVPFLLLTSVLAVSWAQSGLPESSRAPGDFPNATSELDQTRVGDVAQERPRVAGGAVRARKQSVDRSVIRLE